MEYLVAASSKCWDCGTQRVLLLAIVTEKLHEIERLLSSCFALPYFDYDFVLTVTIFHLTLHLALESS